MNYPYLFFSLWLLFCGFGPNFICACVFHSLNNGGEVRIFAVVCSVINHLDIGTFHLEKSNQAKRQPRKHNIAFFPTEVELIILN